MTSEKDDRAASGRLVSGVRAVVGANAAMMLLLGVLAGASIGFLGKGVVSVPVVGPVSGWILGVGGLLLAAVVYARWGSKCGCTGDCNGSCSV